MHLLPDIDPIQINHVTIHGSIKNIQFSLGIFHGNVMFWALKNPLAPVGPKKKHVEPSVRRKRRLRSQT